jgi:hypothetical protein
VRATYFESIGAGRRVTIDETSLETSWAETKSLLGKLPLPGASARHRTVTIEVDGIFGTSFRTDTETRSILNCGAGSTCAKTAAEIDDSVDSSREAVTSGDTLRDAGGCRRRADDGIGDGVGSSTGSKVEFGVDTESLNDVRYLQSDQC